MSCILVVDDEPNIAASLQSCLSQEGYEVFTAHDGASALRALGEREVDLVILDIVMPGMDGIEVLKKIKSYYPGIGVIFCTAHEDLSVAVDATLEHRNLNNPIASFSHVSSIGFHIIFSYEEMTC